MSSQKNENEGVTVGLQQPTHRHGRRYGLITQKSNFVLGFTVIESDVMRIVEHLCFAYTKVCTHLYNVAICCEIPLFARHPQHLFIGDRVNVSSEFCFVFVPSTVPARFAALLKLGELHSAFV